MPELGGKARLRLADSIGVVESSRKWEIEGKTIA
jgi:hypothetical protein